MVCSCDRPHLSFQYGSVQMFSSRNTDSSIEVSSDEPSSWSGRHFCSDAVVGCIAVTLPCPVTAVRGPGETSWPNTTKATPRAQRAIVVAVPSQAPRRPKARGLQICLARGNVAAFDHLLEADAAAASRMLPDGTKPLSFAVDLLRKSGESSRSFSALSTMILSLIEHQADVNGRAQSGEQGDTPLHVLLRFQPEREVVQLCRARLVVALLRAKADPNALDDSGDSPLVEAATAGDLEMCKLLLEHGADAKPPWSGLDPKVSLLLEEALARKQNMLSHLIASGLSFLRQDPDRAASYFADALAMDPLNPDLLLAAAEAEYGAGNFSSAYNHASTCVAIDPMNGLPYAMCAQALWQLDRMEEALAITDLTPDGAASKKSAAEVSARMSKHSKCLSAVEDFLSQNSHADLCKCDEATQDLQSLLTDLTPHERASSWGLRVRLAFVKLCILQSQPENARQHWTAQALSETKLLKKTHRSWQVLYWHARALLQAGCREDAKSTLRCATQLPGGEDSTTSSFLNTLIKAEALQAEGDLAAKQSCWDTALQRYEDAEDGAAFDPDFHALLLAEKAMAKLMLKRREEALKDVCAGLNIVSSFARLYFVRGLIHMDLGMYPQAAADFDRVAAIDPKEVPGELHEKARRWALAPPVEDHYAALGVSKTATDKEIKRAYRLAALKWHPDKNVGNELLAEQVFKQIQAAFDVLSCEASRKAYDDYPGDRKPFQFPSPATTVPCPNAS